MAKFEFPQNPGTQRENPFEDAQGDNPFSDGTSQPPDPVAENLFAGPAAGDEPACTRREYDPILVANPDGALRLAILGAVPAGLGVLGAAIGVTATGSWTTPLFYSLPVQFASLAVALPACIIARRDLRAIRAGAMSDVGRRKSRIAFWLGAFATLLGAAPVVLYFGLVIVYAFGI